MAKLRAFTMPKWGIEMTEGVVAEWLVAEGAPFRKGDLLALIETDKITNEVEAEQDGAFLRLVAAPGETYPVGALIAVLAEGEGTPDPAEVEAFVSSFRAADTRTAAQAADGPAPASPPSPPPPSPGKIADDVAISPAARALAEERGIDVADIDGSGRGGRITFQDVLQASLPPAGYGGDAVDIGVEEERPGGPFASPLARRLAARHGIDLGDIRGTGPRGRISKADVLSRMDEAAAAPVEPGAVDIIRMSPMRKAIARALTASKSTIPHFYLRGRVRLDPILALRDRAKAATGAAPSVNDYLVRACALALVRHPDVNIQVHGEEIHRFGSADIAMAVATDKGLVTPIVHGAERLSIAAISGKIRELADKARAGRLRPEEFQGGSFSISNLGMFGIDQFDAIINPPQGAILAVGAGVRRPVEIGHALAFATMVELSLSCDHRAIDGAVGALFMRTLKELIEAPESLVE